MSPVFKNDTPTMDLNPEALRDAINRCWQARTPFLFAIDYELTGGFLIPEPDLATTEVGFVFPGGTNKPARETFREARSPGIVQPDPDSYRRLFDGARGALASKAVQVVNLSERTRIAPGVDARDLFLASRAPYQIYVPGRFVCFSPECFVRITADGTITTRPIKGTINAACPDAEHTLMTSPKEIAEHTATVRLVEEELANIAKGVHVARFRAVETIETRSGTLLQTVSDVSGTLDPADLDRPGDLLFRLLPAGSVTGVPRAAAHALIQALETRPRGYYCGIAGYSDGQTLETAVLIRFIEIEGETLWYRSGGGVTADSVCDREYAEILDKIYLQ
ncbi:aminodeoxychorismate synthase component I [Phaeovibrio sulfidiphilus]|uniref:Aminodeoxychorismate synthase component I n=1 Tax=Phaeovibrio sulfidiphilus TaxID=1220600 RepID=A0A8J6YJW8_9PROT|nr:aminodeoxychorismate synthase component I [Phaeovibrio sulfidiphilus]MBE1237761.1 aminodeoxychorismate synthase component I [Phaeovibrio sulfidiphilus]